MLSLTEYKNALGPAVTNYTENELERGRQIIEKLADIIVSQLIDQGRAPGLAPSVITLKIAIIETIVINN